MSTRPTRSRTASHSSATIGNAFERFRVGVSSNFGGANSSGVSSPQVQPHRQPAALIASWAGALRSGRPAGSCSFG